MGNNLTKEKSETVINCPIHNTQYNGICGEKNCDESGLICLLCEPTPCTVIKGHKLISIDEFYMMFFTKSLNTLDFKKLKEIIESFKRIDKDQLTAQIEKFNNYVEFMVNEKLKNFSQNIQNRLEAMKRNVNQRLENIHREYLDADSRLDLANFEVPENFSLEETKKFFEKNIRSVKDMENMINLVKKYSDNEKLQMNQKDMETILYAKNLADFSNQEIIDEKIQVIMREFKEDLNDLLSIIACHKKTTSIFYSGLKKFQTNPCDLKFKEDITLQAQKSYTIDSVFAAYTTVDGESYVAWANKTHEINIYDLKTNMIVKSLIGHSQHVYIVRHFFSVKDNTDYLLSTSYERTCKIWNANTLTLTLNIPKCHTGFNLYSAVIIFDDLKSYVVTTAPNELTKVWDLTNGSHIKDIATTTDYTYFINTWYDKKNNEIYIINANSTDIKLYDFKTGLKFRTFKSEASTWHMSALVYDINNVAHLFETDGHGFLRIWEISSGTIFQTMKCEGCNLRGITVWNDQYIIAASSDLSFKVFDLTNYTLAASISGHDNIMCTVEKLVHPLYGEVLLTSAIDGKIKLWVGAIIPK